MGRWSKAATGVVPVLVLLGCGSSEEPAVLSAATAFQRAVAAQDSPAACALLSDEARERLEAAAARPCAEALLALDLPGDAVRSTEVWGGEAQVRLSSQVIFLAELGDGWRVTGAGCTPRPDQPYACRVRA
ncbi:hypothetical protein GCM10022197_12050 [Microlunatus spumicola]|uniref:Lipoprotein n=1 Tax=Microlunatus spumicola TaxID=81499 RepID=A0ABP6WYD3_9ACTN